MANEDGTLLDRLQRRDLQPPRAAARARSRGPPLPHRAPTPKRSCTPTRNSAPAASIASKACSRSPSTTARRRELFIARDRLGKKPLFHAVLGGALHFASEIKALAQSPAWNGDARPRRARRLSVARLFPRAATIYRHVRKLEPGHWLRVGNGRIESPPVLGHRASSTPTTDRTPRVIDELDALLRARRARPPRKRSAARRVSVGRHRFRPGRVVHGRGARRPTSSPTSVGFEHARAQRARGRGADARAAFPTPHITPRSIEPQLDDVLDPIVERLRRAVRRFVGDSDLLRVANGAPARHRRAQRRRRRRSVRRLRLPLRAARARSARPGGSCPAARAGASRGLARRASGRARRRLPRPLRLGTLLENLGRDRAGGLLRRSLLPEAGARPRAARPGARSARSTTARSTTR